MPSKLVLILTVVTVLSQTVLSDAATFTILEPRDASANCTFEGNQDFYGIGVRLGFYLQWFAGLIAFTLNTEDSSTQAEVQTIFLLANFIALLLFQSQKASTTNVVVPILLFYMFFGGSVTAVTSAAVSLQGWRGKQLLTQKIAFIARQTFVLLTSFCLLIYSFYFWCTGLRKFKQFPAECGGTFVFPVAHRVSVDKTTAGAVLGLLLLIVLLLAICLIAYKRLQGNLGWFETLLPRAFRTRTQRKETFEQKEDIGVPWDKEQRYGLIFAILHVHEMITLRRVWTIAGASLITFALLWSILGIELTLKWNRVTGVNDVKSTSQHLIKSFMMTVADFWTVRSIDPVHYWNCIASLHYLVSARELARLEAKEHGPTPG